MNFEPFEPFARSEPMATVATRPSAAPQVSDPGPADEPAMPRYFDGTGLLWIAACLLFACWAGQVLPLLAQPDGWQRSLVAMGWAMEPPPPAAPADTAAPVQSHQQVDARVMPAALRQF